MYLCLKSIHDFVVKVALRFRYGSPESLHPRLQQFCLPLGNREHHGLRLLTERTESVGHEEARNTSPVGKFL